MPACSMRASVMGSVSEKTLHANALLTFPLMVTVAFHVAFFSALECDMFNTLGQIGPNTL